MNRRTFIRNSAVVATFTAVLPASHAASKGEGVIGKMDAAEFKQINKEAGAKLSAIKPESGQLSEADHKLLVDVATGGMMQLEASLLAVKTAKHPDVRAIAQAETEEQTGLAAKLKEIAKLKNAALPPEPDQKGKKVIAELQSLSGEDFDRAYLKESGVKGHELLESVMEKVQAKAADPTLKAVAMTALPLIRTHLQVSRDEMRDLT